MSKEHENDRRRHDDPQVEATLALANAVNELACAVSQTSNNQILSRIEQKVDQIMATQIEIIADLKASNTQLAKLIEDTAAIQPSMDALTAKIAELEALIAAGGAISQELIETVAETKRLAQAVDDNIPERPAPPTV